MAQTAENFFEGGAKAAKFEDRAFGTVIGGDIVSDPRMVQQRDYDDNSLVFYPDGAPAMQMVVTVQAQPATGEDDGQRAFYIKNQLRQAVGEALRKVGETTLRRGGRLWVRYESDEPTTLKNGKPGHPKKIHAAKYEPPSQAQAAAFLASPAAAPVASAANNEQVTATADTMRASANAAPATQFAQGGRVGLACPEGIDPQRWAQMDGAQQQQMYSALGLGHPVARPASDFSDEPPF